MAHDIIQQANDGDAPVVNVGDAQSPSALQRWHATFNAWLRDERDPNIIAEELHRNVKINLAQQAKHAKECGKRDDEAILLGLADQISLGEVRAWIVGKEVPREKWVHNALMDAVRLDIHVGKHCFTDDEVRDLPALSVLSKSKLKKMGEYYEKLVHDWNRLDPATRDRAGKRRELADLFNEACEERRKIPLVTVNCNGLHRHRSNGYRSGHTGISGETVGFRDGPHMPERLLFKEHNSCDSYDQLSREELRSILERTENVCEFLRCWRILQPSEKSAGSMSQDTVAETLEVVNSYYHGIEMGKNLPSAVMMENAGNLFKEGSEEHTRFIELCIKNRLLWAASCVDPAHPDQYDPHHATYIMRGMPRFYWTEALHKTNGTDRNGSTPKWSSFVPELANQGEYLRAVRYVLGLTQEEVAPEIGMNYCTPGHQSKLIEAVEYDEFYHHAPKEVKDRIIDVRQKLVEFYQKRQQDHRTQWFKQDVFDTLPSGTSKFRRTTLREHVQTAAKGDGAAID